LIQLVKRSISGDADAFLELMEKNSLAMYKVARGILDNDEDAADAIHDPINRSIWNGDCFLEIFV
jgi:DNA-directed RNA polymerase specialized sigma24 family protein